MTTLGENANNDIYLDANSNLATVSGLDEIQQIAVSRMETMLGECVLNLSNGMPYDATMWTRYLPQQFEAAGRATLKASPGVTGVLSFTVSRQGDIGTYVAQIQTALGTATVRGIIPNV